MTPSGLPAVGCQQRKRRVVHPAAGSALPSAPRSATPVLTAVPAAPPPTTTLALALLLTLTSAAGRLARVAGHAPQAGQPAVRQPRRCTDVVT
jgi:hypothetical protein